MNFQLAEFQLAYQTQQNNVLATQFTTLTHVGLKELWLSNVLVAKFVRTHNVLTLLAVPTHSVELTDLPAHHFAKAMEFIKIIQLTAVTTREHQHQLVPMLQQHNYKLLVLETKAVLMELVPTLLVQLTHNVEQIALLVHHSVKTEMFTKTI